MSSSVAMGEDRGIFMLRFFFFRISFLWLGKRERVLIWFNGEIKGDTHKTDGD